MKYLLKQEKGRVVLWYRNLVGKIPLEEVKTKNEKKNEL